MSDINAKVAALITDTELAFNVGSEAGVKRGDTVRLYSIIEVNDPDTREPLGKVQVPKLDMKVSLVELKYCVATVTDRASSSKGTTKVIFAGISPLKTVTTTPDPFNSSDTVYVRIGEQAVIHLAAEAAETQEDESAD